MPRPSSATSTMMRPSAWRAVTRIWPRSGLPAAIRSAAGSIPWSSALRTRWAIGSPISSSSERSSSVSRPSRTRSTSLPSCAERSRTSRGKRLKIVSIGIIRSCVTPAWRRADDLGELPGAILGLRHEGVFPEATGELARLAPQPASSGRSAPRPGPSGSSSWPTSIRMVWVVARRGRGCSGHGSEPGSVPGSAPPSLLTGSDR